jgi:hypothetical protein
LCPPAAAISRTRRAPHVDEVVEAGFDGHFGRALRRGELVAPAKCAHHFGEGARRADIDPLDERRFGRVRS